MLRLFAVKVTRHQGFKRTVCLCVVCGCSFSFPVAVINTLTNPTNLREKGFILAKVTAHHDGETWWVAGD